MKLTLALIAIMSASALITPPRTTPDADLDASAPDANASVPHEALEAVERADRAIQQGEDCQAVLDALRRELTRLGVVLEQVERDL